MYLLPVSNRQVSEAYFKALKAISNSKTRNEIIATNRFLKVVNKQLKRHGYRSDSQHLDTLWIAQFNAIKLKE